MTKCPDVDVACFADCHNLIVEHQVRVENDSETRNRRRQRHARTSNVDTFKILHKSSQTLYNHVMIDAVKCCGHVERDHDGETAAVNGIVDVIRHLEQRCFGGMSSTAMS